MEAKEGTQTTLRFDAELRRAIKTEAERSGTTMTEWLSRLATKALEENPAGAACASGDVVYTDKRLEEKGRLETIAVNRLLTILRSGDETIGSAIQSIVSGCCDIVCGEERFRHIDEGRIPRHGVGSGAAGAGTGDRGSLVGRLRAKADRRGRATGKDVPNHRGG